MAESKNASVSRMSAPLMVFIGVVVSNLVAVFIALSYSASRNSFVLSTGWEKLMSIVLGVGGIGIVAIMVALLVFVLYLIINEKLPVRLRWLIGFALVAALLFLAPLVEFDGMFSWMSFFVTVGTVGFVVGFTWYFIHVTRPRNPIEKEEVKKDA